MNHSIFQEPSEKGSNEYYPMKEGKFTIREILFLIVCLVTFSGVMYVATTSSPSVTASDEVVEIDGVLYFPDGNPVRNYEQLYLYEQEG